jgi:hypothetical protein
LRIIVVRIPYYNGERGKEETITIVDFIDAARERRRLAPLGDGEQMWSRLLAGQEARYIREQEEAAIEAEDFWGQAEEACSVDPIG